MQATFVFNILMENYIRIAIKVEDERVREELIARLSINGFDGFEEDEKILAAFIVEDKLNEQQLKSLLNAYSLTYTKTIIPPQNWNEVWESSFSPVVVGDFCAVRAHFHPAIATVKNEIIITPKMSFGTGHHATTYLMLQEMEHISFMGKRTADFGTGTGVLSIMAEKLGSTAIIAIDNDDWSIANAGENISQNNCRNIVLKKADEFSPLVKYGVILANINRNIILANLDGLVFGLERGGMLLLSGLLKQDEEVVLKECSNHNLFVLKTVERDNWIAILLQENN
ncbi:MAG: ribosomal protein methyltransferase [Segetibacter sp.]|nr:ribosomal protein methyltransferase [Segetibacter sp.]